MNFITKLFQPKEQPDYRHLFENGAMIIDVRSAAEFNSGHIRGSVNIPLDILKKHFAKLKEHKKGIITVCRSGNRSAIAKGMLQSSGIAAVNGGAWDKLNKKINP